MISKIYFCEWEKICIRIYKSLILLTQPISRSIVQAFVEYSRSHSSIVILKENYSFLYTKQNINLKFALFFDSQSISNSNFYTEQNEIYTEQKQILNKVNSI